MTPPPRRQRLQKKEKNLLRVIKGSEGIIMEFISRVSQSSAKDEIIRELTQDPSGGFDLGALFLSPMPESDAQEIAQGLRKKINVKNLLACTCAGIIGSDVELENQPAASLILSKLPGVEIRPFFLNQSQLEALQTGEDWHNFFEIYPNENPVFLILPDPFQLDMNLFLESINRVYPNCPMIGGLASASGQPNGNTLILNNDSYDHGMVGFVLTGNFRAETVVSQGCRPIGKTYIVTKAQDNIIYEIAGKKFLSVLSSVMNQCSERDRLLMQEAVFIGIAMDEYKHDYKRGDFLIRGLMGIDRQSEAGVIGDLIRLGQTIQFHVRDAQSATEDLHELLKLQQNHVKNQKPKGALVFSCNGRGERLFRQKNHDIEVIQQYIGPVPAAGFFCAGEIGNVGKQNFLHGFTNSMVLFYPRT
jgi:small ligand-binding sensory domain FIST